MIQDNAKTFELLKLASELLQEDIINIAEKDAAFFARNEISAILVSLASISAHEKLPVKPQFYAGYSVGQWTAMHLAGMLTADTLLSVLIHRAQLMNKTRAVGEGAMLAVIGIPREKVDAVIAEAQGYLIIANDNAPAQFTLSGEHAAIDAAEKQLAELKPQRLLRVPVAGAWHSAMVGDAVKPFREYLSKVELAAPSIPVISNVTAQLLPADPRDELAAHVASPVQWQQTIRYLIEQGVDGFIEVGFGNTLSKFGFFIDRTRQHLTWQKLQAG